MFESTRAGRPTQIISAQCVRGPRLPRLAVMKAALWLVLLAATLPQFANAQTTVAQNQPKQQPQVQETQDTQQTPDGTISTREKRLDKDDESTLYRERIYRSDNYRGTGFALFLGMNGGYITSAYGDPQNETAKSGYQLGGKFLGSIYPEHWVIDFGIGWFYSKIQGKERTIEEKSGNLNSEPESVKILTQAAFVEFAPRYRLSKNWQLGVVADLMFGTDLSFGAVPNNQNFVGMIGPQLMYGVPEKFLDMRWGIEALTDINVSSRQMFTVLLTAQFGLPILKPESIVREKELYSTKRRVERQEVPRIVNKMVVKEVMKFVFENDEIRFDPRRANLPASNQGFLLELANTLTRVQATWKELNIEATVENTGDDAFNQKLSAARAAAVKNALVSGSVPIDVITSTGLGVSRLPPGSPSGKLNHIVLSFSGVTNAQKLNDAINKLQKLKARPETCTEAGCK